MQTPEQEHNGHRSSGSRFRAVRRSRSSTSTRTRRPRDPAPSRELHVCPDCDSQLVFPVHWTRGRPDAAGKSTLRCPNCEWAQTGVFDQDTVERFDEELDRGTDELVDDLKRLIHANMEEEIDRFCKALSDDHVLPEDF